MITRKRVLVQEKRSCASFGERVLRRAEIPLGGRIGKTTNRRKRAVAGRNDRRSHVDDRGDAAKKEPEIVLTLGSPTASPAYDDGGQWDVDDGRSEGSPSALGEHGPGEGVVRTGRAQKKGGVRWLGERAKSPSGLGSRDQVLKGRGRSFDSKEPR